MIRARFFGIFIIIVIFLAFTRQSILAASNSQNLSVHCNGTDEIDDCVITPSGGKLFHETGVLPGDQFIQFLDITNTTNQKVFPSWAVALSSTESSLAQIIDIEIRSGSVTGPVVMTRQTLASLFNSNQFQSLSELTPQSTQRYVVVATVHPSAGNEYQGAHSSFNLAVNVQLESTQSSPTPTSTPSSITSSGQTQGITSSNNLAESPVCTAIVPSSAPILSITGPTDNLGNVTLNWTAVAPVTTYAINFGVQPGIYLYGNANVGNTTSYTVGGLTQNTQYYFQVIPINDCAPGPRSNEVVTPGQPIVAGVVAPPIEFTEGGVLGENVESIFPTPLLSPTQFPTQTLVFGNGSVAGNSVCQEIWTLPLGILAIQLIAHGMSYIFLRNTLYRLQLISHVTLVLASIFLFYTLYDCSIQTWLSNWYWLLASTFGLLGTITHKLSQSAFHYD